MCFNGFVDMALEKAEKLWDLGRQCIHFDNHRRKDNGCIERFEGFTTHMLDCFHGCN